MLVVHCNSHESIYTTLPAVCLCFLTTWILYKNLSSLAHDPGRRVQECETLFQADPAKKQRSERDTVVAQFLQLRTASIHARDGPQTSTTMTHTNKQEYAYLNSIKLTQSLSASYSSRPEQRYYNTCICRSLYAARAARSIQYSTVQHIVQCLHAHVKLPVYVCMYVSRPK